MNNPKDIAEKIINSIKTDIKSYSKYASFGVEIEYLALYSPELARAYLELESRILKPAPGSVHQAQYYIDIINNLKTKLSLEQQDRESEKRTYKTRIEAAEGYITELKIKLILANNTIHGEFCGEKCHPLHLEVNI